MFKKSVSWLLKKFLSSTPASWRHSVQNRLPETWIYRIQQIVKGREWQRIVDATSVAKALEAKLWGGYSEPALKELCAMMDDDSVSLTEKSEAAWVTARWYWCQGELEQVATSLTYIRENVPEGSWRKSFRLLEIDYLMTLSDTALARQRAEELVASFPNCPHCKLVLSNTWARINETKLSCCGNDERLQLINAVYKEAGVSQIRKIDAEAPLSLANVCGQSQPFSNEKVFDVKVSIIMPVYEASETLAIALESLLKQTWTNIEIIVVDDCSPDDTVATAQSFAQRDSRVRVVQQKTNQGAYSARNLGLQHTTGEFVTTHDADDWSHPQKIEIQVRDLLNNPKHKANMTHWVRAYPNLYFRSASRPSDRLIHKNYSSLMTTRKLLMALGGWDRVRVTGDTELAWRLEHHPSGGKPVRLMSKVPLSFALEQATSLTRNSLTHFSTNHYGVRRVYREAIVHWHEHAKNLELPPLGPDLSTEQMSSRPFPAPGPILPFRQSWTVDRLMLMDFNVSGPAVEQAFQMLEGWIKDGLTVGVFQWCYYPLDVREPLNRVIRDLAFKNKLRVIAPGEQVKSKEVWLCSPVLAMYKIDLPPEIDANSIRVKADTFSASLISVSPIGWKSEIIEKNLGSIFELPIEWVH